MRCLWDGMCGATTCWRRDLPTTPGAIRNQRVGYRLNMKLFTRVVTTKYLSEWTLGNSPHYAGWHCSWCYPPSGIKIKLESAQRHDKPRWGDFPDKLNLDYIASLIRNGEWFDGKHPFIPVNRRKTSASIYAPPFFLDNEDRFEYLLVPPDDRVWQSDPISHKHVKA